MRAKFVNEDIKDFLKPKSEEEINKGLVQLYHEIASYLYDAGHFNDYEEAYAFAENSRKTIEYMFQNQVNMNSEEIAKYLWWDKHVFESLENILKPKSQEEIDKNFIEKYGFVPDEETLVLFIDLKRGEADYSMEFHRSPDGEYWKKKPGQYPLMKLSNTESIWILQVINGEIKFGSHWTKGKNFKKL